MKRSPFCQHLMEMNYGSVALEAIANGFDESLERLIAKSLRIYVKSGHSEAEVILQAAGGDYMKAAHLITHSKISENANH